MNEIKQALKAYLTVVAYMVAGSAVGFTVFATLMILTK